MLQRHQIILEDWQTDYVKALSKKQGLSFCNIIRQAINYAAINKAQPLTHKKNQSAAEFEARKQAQVNLKKWGCL